MSTSVNGYFAKRFGTIVLASTSPRRADILRQIGFEIAVVPSDYKEDAILAEPGRGVMEHGQAKAEKVARLYPDQIVLGADTAVCLEETIIGKPRDAHDAFEMLSMLSGKTHHVYTGFCLMHRSRNILISAVEKSAVTFRSLKADEINWYIQTGSPFDKAGAYGIQDQSAIFVERIEGDYYNIVGLPISAVHRELDRHF